jgi:hypothetical protein
VLQYVTFPLYDSSPSATAPLILTIFILASTQTQPETKSKIMIFKDSYKRHYAARLKVAVSRPDELNAFFQFS